MKKLLLSFGLWLGLTTLAAAQCVAVGGVNSVPQTGMNCLSEPSVATYGATSVALIPASSATDIACLTGSATRVIRLQRAMISGSGTAISVPVLLRKNASANSGGTLATSTALPVPYRLDSNNAAPTATTSAWTANPTVNDTTPGILDNGNLGLVATTVGAGVQPGLVFNYSDRNFSQAPTLRGIAQQLCINLTATSPTALLNITFRWTEAAQ